MLRGLTRKAIERTFNRWAKQFDDERGILDVHVRPDDRFACALFTSDATDHPFIVLLRVRSGEPVVPSGSHDLWVTGSSLWWPRNEMYVELSDSHNGLHRYAVTEDLTAITSVGNVTPAEGDHKVIEWYCKLSLSGVHWHRLREYHDGRAELLDEAGWLFHYEDLSAARKALPEDYFNIARYNVDDLIEKDRAATEKLLNREPFPEPGAPEKQFIAYFGKKRTDIADSGYENARAIRHRIDQTCWDSHRETAERLRRLKVLPPMAADRKELAKLMQQQID